MGSVGCAGPSVVVFTLRNLDPEKRLTQELGSGHSGWEFQMPRHPESALEGGWGSPRLQMCLSPDSIASSSHGERYGQRKVRMVPFNAQGSAQRGRLLGLRAVWFVTWDPPFVIPALLSIPCRGPLPLSLSTVFSQNTQRLPTLLLRYQCS